MISISRFCRLPLNPSSPSFGQNRGKEAGRRCCPSVIVRLMIVDVSFSATFRGAAKTITLNNVSLSFHQISHLYWSLTRHETRQNTFDNRTPFPFRWFSGKIEENSALAISRPLLRSFHLARIKYTSTLSSVFSSFEMYSEAISRRQNRLVGWNCPNGGQWTQTEDKYWGLYL